MDDNYLWDHLNVSGYKLKHILALDTALYVNTHNTDMEDHDFVSSISEDMSSVFPHRDQGSDHVGYAEYNYDQAENMEDESLMAELPSPFYPHITKSIDTQLQEKEGDTGLSSDSLAFTITYCSVFTITLLYVGVKLVKRWKMRSAVRLPTTRQQMPWCGHAHCSQVQQSNGRSRYSYLPYSGLGSAWIPSIVRLPPPVPLPVHATASCNDGCDSCRRLALPPPSYTKLFLEEQPPSYGDAVGRDDSIAVLVEDENSTVDEAEDNVVVDTVGKEDSMAVMVFDDHLKNKDGGRPQS